LWEEKGLGEQEGDEIKILGGYFGDGMLEREWGGRSEKWRSEMWMGEDFVVSNLVGVKRRLEGVLRE
jgi:hypothetical protein